MTDRRFDYFVIFGEMRTGSNFLEESLRDFPELALFGEAFNPVFVGKSGREEMLGVTLAERERDPLLLLDAIRDERDRLPGFRFFDGHDPRILEVSLADSRCGKVILTRNPVESYVSRKIAKATGQWRLGDMRHAKSARVGFDPAEFETHLAAVQDFQVRLLRALQTTGQTAFYLDYEDIGDVEVLNGLARFLGVAAEKKRTTRKTKVQNPGPVIDKVSNPEEMVAALGSFDRFNLSRTPNFEPRRGPSVPSYVAARDVPLLYLPIPGGPDAPVRSWLASLDDAGPDAPVSGFNQKTLRQWRRARPGHRSFSVLWHPVRRLHHVFARHLLPVDDTHFADLRAALGRLYGVVLPDPSAETGWGAAEHRAAFLGFARFVRGNLARQTGFKVAPLWASQVETLAGFSQLAPPDRIVRENELTEELGAIAAQVGCDDPGQPPPDAPDLPIALDDIYDAEVEAAVRAAYPRDYLTFGLGPWRSDGA